MLTMEKNLFLLVGRRAGTYIPSLLGSNLIKGSIWEAYGSLRGVNLLWWWYLLVDRGRSSNVYLECFCFVFVVQIPYRGLAFGCLIS